MPYHPRLIPSHPSLLSPYTPFHTRTPLTTYLLTTLQIPNRHLFLLIIQKHPKRINIKLQ